VPVAALVATVPLVTPTTPRSGITPFALPVTAVRGTRGPVTRPSTSPVDEGVVGTRPAARGAIARTTAATIPALTGLTVRLPTSAPRRRAGAIPARCPATRSTPSAWGAAAGSTPAGPATLPGPAFALLVQPQAEPDPVAGDVNAENLHLHHVARLDHVPRVRDVAGRHR